MSIDTSHALFLLLLGALCGAPFWLLIYCMLTISPDLDDPKNEDMRNDRRKNHC